MSSPDQCVSTKNFYPSTLHFDQIIPRSCSCMSMDSGNSSDMQWLHQHMREAMLFHDLSVAYSYLCRGANYKGYQHCDHTTATGTMMHHCSFLINETRWPASFNAPRSQQNCRHNKDDILKLIFLNGNAIIPRESSIGSGNGLVPNRRQAITWSYADPVHWRTSKHHNVKYLSMFGIIS